MEDDIRIETYAKVPDSEYNSNKLSDLEVRIHDQPNIDRIERRNIIST